MAPYVLMSSCPSRTFNTTTTSSSSGNHNITVRTKREQNQLVQSIIQDALNVLEDVDDDDKAEHNDFDDNDMNCWLPNHYHNDEHHHQHVIPQ